MIPRLPDPSSLTPTPGILLLTHADTDLLSLRSARADLPVGFPSVRALSFGKLATEEHLAAALRYVSLNPVRARLVERAQDWRWSSTRAHLRGKADGVTALSPIRDRFPDFRSGSPDDQGGKPRPDLLKEMSVAEVGAAAVKWKEQLANWAALRMLLAD